MRHLIIPYQPEDSLERQTKRQSRTNTRKRKVKKEGGKTSKKQVHLQHGFILFLRIIQATKYKSSKAKINNI